MRGPSAGRAAEELGFDHAWTYDHLVWAGLPDSPVFAFAPTLALAAAGDDSTIGLGVFVGRRPTSGTLCLLRDRSRWTTFARARPICGLGTGGDLDAQILGEDRPLKQRVERFHEFTQLLDRLLREDHVDHDGELLRHRSMPHPARARAASAMPMVVAGNGPRSVSLAADSVTRGRPTGKGARPCRSGGRHRALCGAARRSECSGPGRQRGPSTATCSLDGSPRYALESVGLYAEKVTGRAAELGFTDVVTHWPRPDGVYAGREAVLEEVACRLPVTTADPGAHSLALRNTAVALMTREKLQP